MKTIGVPTRRAIFEAMVAMAWADARIEREEVLAVQAAGRVLDLPEDALDALDAGPPSMSALAEAGLAEGERRLVFLCASWLASVDAREDEDEEVLLVELASALSISESDSHRLRDEARLLRATTPATVRWHEELEGMIEKGGRPPRLMADELRELMWRHMQEIREAFTPQLAAKLGRPVEVILRDGLRAGDFSPRASVRLTLGDGSRMELRYAFVVIDEARGTLAIFSEHCGYFVYGTAGLTVEVLRDGEVEAAYRF